MLVAGLLPPRTSVKMASRTRAQAPRAATPEGLICRRADEVFRRRQVQVARRKAREAESLQREKRKPAQREKKRFHRRFTELIIRLNLRG